MNRERFEKWVMATKHPVYGFLDGRSLARGDDRTGYADEYVQGLWVAYLAFGIEQPQGEPVALTIQQRIKWMMCFNADLYEDWLGDNIPEDDLPAWLTEEGVPESLPGSQLAKVLSYELQYANSRLAEQPAPVAVVLPEFEPAFEKWWEEDGQYCRAGGGSYEKTFAYRAYEAALADVTRLNTK